LIFILKRLATKELGPGVELLLGGLLYLIELKYYPFGRCFTLTIIDVVLHLVIVKLCLLAYAKFPISCWTFPVLSFETHTENGARCLLAVTKGATPEDAETPTEREGGPRIDLISIFYI